MKKLITSVVVGSLVLTPVMAFAADKVMTQTQQNQRLQQRLEDGSAEKTQTMTKNRAGDGTGSQSQNKYQYKKGSGNGSASGTQTKNQFKKSK